MINRFLIYLGLLTVISLSFIHFQMCDSESTDPQNGEPPVDVTGSWELTTTITSNTIGIPNGGSETGIVYLSDSSGVISITVFSGHWGDGTVVGRTIRFVGIETSKEFGCPATLVTEGTGSVSESEILGVLKTTVTFDLDTCGTHSDGEINLNFSMTKMGESPCLDRAIFGDPQKSLYVLPYPIEMAYPVYQSYCWPTGGHRNQLAYDFTVPIGDTIVAARTGVVREVREDSPDNGQGEGQHNYVFIEHGDGTLAFYAHLMQYSVVVNPGDTVDIGEYFALSGNSGKSSEPHLHFGVYEDYPPTEGLDIPVNFRNAKGLLDSRGGLIRGEIYTALPYQ